MKNNKPFKIILIIIGIGIILTFLYCALMFLGLFLGIVSGFKNINNNKVEYKLDYENKLSEDGVKEYIKEKLQNKYNETFEVVKIKKANIEECKTGIDSYYCYAILDNAYEYNIIMKNNNNIYFSVFYSDPYYSKLKKEKNYTYYSNNYNDNYNYMKLVNKNSELNTIIESIKAFAEKENLEIKNIYYITDDFFEIHNYCNLRLEIDFSDKLVINKELAKKIYNYYSSKLDEFLTYKYHVIINENKYFLSKSDLIVNDNNIFYYI